MQKVKLQPYLVLRTKKEHDQYIANVVSNYIAEYMKPHRKDAFDKGVDAGLTYGIDMAILALGRMAEGANEAKTCENCLRYNVSCVPNERIEQECAARGREGWYPKKVDISNPEFFTNFMKQIADAASDYSELFDIDLEENHDKDYWWSGSKLDKELYDYISPDVYPSFEERYKRGGVKSTTS